jgi:3-hydroxyanthranilate 3,4-dioxygenase
MFVGGPNSRTDFHIEQGSELFFQLRGGMELPTIQVGRSSGCCSVSQRSQADLAACACDYLFFALPQAGKLKLVKIPEGHFFVLPPRIPHSPQRPEENSLGLVIERARVTGEMDAMRWYTDFATCNELLYERWFRCEDLARDLPPIVKAFKASHECATGQRRAPCPILN